jgi:hypothetical protein
MSQTISDEHVKQQPVIDASIANPVNDPLNFVKNWKICTSPERVSLFGFRRFQTSQLLNLRFLEEEIADLDEDMYHAGLKLATPDRRNDRLGLRGAQRLADDGENVIIVTPAKVQRLRAVLKDYSKITPRSG